MDRKLFLIAREGRLLDEPLRALPMDRILLVFNDDELVQRAEAHLPAGAQVDRYDMREEGVPVRMIEEADAVFVALRDDPHLKRALGFSRRRLIEFA